MRQKADEAKGTPEEVSGRDLTVVFTDIEGSTWLRTTLGDQEANRLFRLHEEITRTAVSTFGGRVIEYLGDGFELAFHKPADAILCCAALQRSLHEHAELNQVRVRMGMSAGPVVEERGVLRGTAVHAAARVSARARGGQILIPSQLVPVAREVDVPGLLDRGLYWLKGLPERWRLYEVVWGPGWQGSAPLPGRTPYVDRHSERADLRRYVDDALNGRGSIVLISGEPGIGKTRLAEEIAAEADGRGMHMLRGRCSEAAGSVPYLPWAEILDAALAQTTSPEAFRAALGAGAGELTRIVPGLRQVLPEVPKPLDLPPEQERRHLFRSVLEFLGRAAQIRPLVLLIDDLQWADEPSMMLFQHLMEGLTQYPILELATYREPEPGSETALSRSLPDVLRHPSVHQVRLPALQEGDIAAMVTSLAGREVPPKLARAISQHTDGNPFFAEETLHDLLERNALLDAEGRWRGEAELGEAIVPRTVRLVIEQRLARLAPTTRDVMSMAAVVGRSFELEVAAQCLGLDDDALLAAVDEAERAALLRAEDPSTDRFEFVHELVRQTCLGNLSTLRQQRAHLLIAAAIEKVFEGREAGHASELAYHLSHGGVRADRLKLRRYLVVAGKQALQSTAFETALGTFEAALAEHWEEDPAGLADLLFHCGLALRSVGRWPEAIGRWTESIDAYEKLGDREATGHVCSEAAAQLGWGGRFVDALEMIGRGLAAMGDLAHPDHARLLAYAAAAFSMGGYREAGDSMLADAYRASAELGRDDATGLVAGVEVLRRWAYLEDEQAVRVADRAVEALRRSGMLWQMVEAASLAGASLYRLCRWREAEELLAEHEPLANRLGNPNAQMGIRRLRFGLELCVRSDIRAFKRLAEEDLARTQADGLPWYAEGYVYTSIAEYLLGRWDRALELAEEAVRAEEEGTVLVGIHRGHLLRMLGHLGLRERALVVMANQAVPLPTPGQVNGCGSWVFLFAMAEALWELGEWGRLADLYPALVQGAATGSVQSEYTYRFAETLAGTAAAARRSWELAEKHFRSALDSAESLRHPFERPEILRAWARMLASRDGPDDVARAKDLLNDAMTSYVELGMQEHHRRASLELRGMDG